MHPVQATETIQWAEKQHQDLVAHAERGQLARSLHRWPATPNFVTSDQIAVPMRVAAAIMLLMAVLAVAVV
jgi:hypothetical protein